MSDPRIIALDIETYGVFKGMTQSAFHPYKSIHLDNISPERLIESCAITTVEHDPRFPSSSSTSTLTLADLQSLRPSESFVFNLQERRTDHLPLLARWLNYADTLILMNAQFDLLYLRAFSPILREILNGRHTIIDLAAINYLESDVRPERSLKTIGPVLLTHSYDKTASSQFPRTAEGTQQMHLYNAEDTHNTIRAVAELSRRICKRPLDEPNYVLPGPDPINATSDLFGSTPLTFYTDLIWSCVFMSENGVPFSRSRLQQLEAALMQKIERSRRLAEARGLLLDGPGSQKSKLSFLEAAVNEAEVYQLSIGNPNFRESPNLQYTEKTRNLKTDDANRNFINANLPPESNAQRTLRIWSIFSRAQKLFSSYVFPMLYHRRNKPDDRRRVLLPPVPQHRRRGGVRPYPAQEDTYISYPTWFIVPSSSKDGAGSSGGTQQARITCKDGPHQTDPPAIQRCRASRFLNGSLASFDLSQIELRVAALLSGDHNLRSAYAVELEGGKADVHADMAISVFGPSVKLQAGYGTGDSLVDPRQWAKQINFLILFAGGPNKLQETLLRECGREFPISECQSIVNSAKRARPQLIQWQDTLVEVAHRAGRITLPVLGQSRSFAPGGKYDKNEIVNFPIQAWAGNILIQIQARLCKRLYSDRHIIPFLNVYDALYFDVDGPTHMARLEEMIAEEVQWVATCGYWHQLSVLTQSNLLLRYDFTKGK